jgi:hypothetical protein
VKGFSRTARADRRNRPTGQGAPTDAIPSEDDSVQHFDTMSTVRGLLLVQLAGFVVLASIHFDVLIGGYGRPPAGATELAIVAAVVVALVLTGGPPARGQRAATAAQLFAMLGVVVGLITVIAGVERGSTLEVALNVALLLTVTTGLVVTNAWRQQRTGSRHAS